MGAAKESSQVQIVGGQLGVDELPMQCTNSSTQAPDPHASKPYEDIGESSDDESGPESPEPPNAPPKKRVKTNVEPKTAENAMVEFIKNETNAIFNRADADLVKLSTVINISMKTFGSENDVNNQLKKTLDPNLASEEQKLYIDHKGDHKSLFVKLYASYNYDVDSNAGIRVRKAEPSIVMCQYRGEKPGGLIKIPAEDLDNLIMGLFRIRNETALDLVKLRYKKISDEAIQLIREGKIIEGQAKQAAARTHAQVCLEALETKKPFHPPGVLVRPAAPLPFGLPATRSIFTEDDIKWLKVIVNDYWKLQSRVQLEEGWTRHWCEKMAGLEKKLQSLKPYFTASNPRIVSGTYSDNED